MGATGSAIATVVWGGRRGGEGRLGGKEKEGGRRRVGDRNQGKRKKERKKEKKKKTWSRSVPHANNRLSLLINKTQLLFGMNSGLSSTKNRAPQVPPVPVLLTRLSEVDVASGGNGVPGVTDIFEFVL